jgi:Flp pilus assembly protein TadG
MRRSKGERGASLVEFALVLPVLAVLIFGIIDFGFAFNSYIELRSGSREGARMAAVNNHCTLTPTVSPCTLGDDAQRDALITKTRARTTGLANANDVDIAISFQDTTPAVGENVEVCLVYPFQSVTGLFSFLNVDLKSKGVMRLEQAPTFSDGTDTGVAVTC